MTAGAPRAWEESAVCVYVSVWEGSIQSWGFLPIAQGVHVRGFNGSAGAQGQCQADWSLA